MLFVIICLFCLGYFCVAYCLFIKPSRLPTFSVYDWQLHATWYVTAKRSRSASMPFWLLFILGILILDGDLRNTEKSHRWRETTIWSESRAKIKNSGLRLGLFDSEMFGIDSDFWLWGEWCFSNERLNPQILMISVPTHLFQFIFDEKSPPYCFQIQFFNGSLIYCFNWSLIGHSFNWRWNDWPVS